MDYNNLMTVSWALSDQEREQAQPPRPPRIRLDPCASHRWGQPMTIPGQAFSDRRRFCSACDGEQRGTMVKGEFVPWWDSTATNAPELRPIERKTK